jgi:hypothetical protein
MRGSTALRKVAAFTLALCIVTMGPIAVNPHVEEDVSPVGDAEAFPCGGACVATGVGIAVATGAGGLALGSLLADTDPAEKEETVQIKIDAYQSAFQQNQTERDADAIGGNAIRSTDVKMQMEGIQALDEAADAGMTKSEAKEYVSGILDNRTTTKQWNAWNLWSASALTVKYIENRTDVAPNIGDNFAIPRESSTEIINMGGTMGPETLDSFNHKASIADSASEWNKTVTLANGTEHTVTRIPLQFDENANIDNHGSSSDETSGTKWVDAANPVVDVQFEAYKSINDAWNNYTITMRMDDYRVKRNNSDDADVLLSGATGPATFASPSLIGDYLSKIGAQNDQVTQTVHNIADAKYSAIKAGEIELPTEANPYFASEMAASEGMSQDAFLATYYSSLGQSNPEDFEKIDTTTIKIGNKTLVGQLLGDGLDNGTTFEEGETINVSDLNGSLIMTTPSGQQRIDTGNVTLDNITTADGSDKSQLTFENEDLDASTIDGYRDAVNWMNEQQAESEAREKNLEDGSSPLAGLLGDGGFLEGNLALIIGLLVAAGIAIRVVTG